MCVCAAARTRIPTCFAHWVETGPFIDFRTRISTCGGAPLLEELLSRAAKSRSVSCTNCVANPARTHGSQPTAPRHRRAVCASIGICAPRHPSATGPHEFFAAAGTFLQWFGGSAWHSTATKTPDCGDYFGPSTRWMQQQNKYFHESKRCLLSRRASRQGIALPPV